MNINDDELQRNIERGHQFQNDDADARAYQQVFRSLEHLSGPQLSSQFSERIIQRVIEKRQHQDKRDMFWFGLGLFCLLVTFVVALVMTAPTFTLGFLKDISPFAGVFVFGATLLAIINWVDKRIVRKHSEII